MHPSTAALLTFTLTLIYTVVVLAQPLPSAAPTKYDAVLILRVNDLPEEHVIHYTGLVFPRHSDHSDGSQHEMGESRRRGTVQVQMHNALAQPLTNIKIRPGDILSVAHASFPGEIVTVTVPEVGEWFYVYFPQGSAETDSLAAIRFLAMQTPDSLQLLTAPYDEYVVLEPPSAGAPHHSSGRIANTPALFPHDAVHHAQQHPPHQRTQLYRTWLLDRWPQWPTNMPNGRNKEQRMRNEDAERADREL